MVELSRQAQAAVKAWMDTQREIWEQWLESSRRLSEVRSVEDWERESGRLVDQWEASAKSALGVPEEQMRRLVDALRDEERVPRELVNWAEDVLGVMREWREAQEPLWEAWFTTARQFGPARRTGNWEEAMDTWRKAATNAAKSQAEWGRRLLERGGRRTAAASRARAGGDAEQATTGESTTEASGGPSRTRRRSTSSRRRSQR